MKYHEYMRLVRDAEGPKNTALAAFINPILDKARSLVLEGDKERDSVIECVQGWLRIIDKDFSEGKFGLVVVDTREVYMWLQFLEMYATNPKQAAAAFDTQYTVWQEKYTSQVINLLNS